MFLLWTLSALLGFIFTLRVAVDYYHIRSSDIQLMFLVFLVYGLGSGCVGVLLLLGKHEPLLHSGIVLQIMVLIIFALLMPVYYRWSTFLKASIELATLIVLFSIGVFFFSQVLKSILPFIGMVSMGCLYFGYYEWLRNHLNYKRA